MEQSIRRAVPAATVFAMLGVILALASSSAAETAGTLSSYTVT